VGTKADFSVTDIWEIQEPREDEVKPAVMTPGPKELHESSYSERELEHMLKSDLRVSPKMDIFQGSYSTNGLRKKSHEAPPKQIMKAVRATRQIEPKTTD